MAAQRNTRSIPELPREAVQARYDGTKRVAYTNQRGPAFSVARTTRTAKVPSLGSVTRSVSEPAAEPVVAADRSRDAALIVDPNELGRRDPALTQARVPGDDPDKPLRRFQATSPKIQNGGRAEIDARRQFATLEIGEFAAQLLKQLPQFCISVTGQATLLIEGMRRHDDGGGRRRHCEGWDGLISAQRL